MAEDFKSKIEPAGRIDGQQRKDAYDLAVGRFVSMYARIEGVLYRTLCHYAKTSDTISQALFSGTRVSQAGDLIKRIAEAESYPENIQEELKGIFLQLKLITTARDRIIHYGAQSVEEGEAFVSDALRNLPSRMKIFLISPEILGDMTEDLRRIGVMLLTRHVGVHVFSETNKKRLEEIVSAPWRYKPQS